MDRNTFSARSYIRSQSNQVELAWLTRYSLPHKIALDTGKELLAEFETMVANDYRIACSPTSIKNPQANAIVERVHQTIGNIVRTFQIQQMDLDNENPWEGILSPTMFAILSLTHTNTHHTPSHPVFGRDAILNINQETNWQLIKHCKQSLLSKDNQKISCVPHWKQSLIKERVGNEIYPRRICRSFYRDSSLTTVYTRKGIIIGTYNLRNITPCITCTQRQCHKHRKKNRNDLHYWTIYHR